MIAIGLALAFVLELIAFIAIADIGLLLPFALPWRITAFVLLLAAIVVFWSLYMAPKAPYRLSGGRYRLVKGLIYAVSAAVIAIEQTPFAAILFALATVWSEIALRRHGDAISPGGSKSSGAGGRDSRHKRT